MPQKKSLIVKTYLTKAFNSTRHAGLNETNENGYIINR